MGNNSHKLTKDNLHIPLSQEPQKGGNGRLCIVGGSDLIHGTAELSGLAAQDVLLKFGSILNDSVYYCSTKENVDRLKEKFPSFLGIYREEFDSYIPYSDVILIGSGMMRIPQENRPSSNIEPEITKKLTLAALKSGKKIVLDAGSLFTISLADFSLNQNIIITPNIPEMAMLFSLEKSSIELRHDSSEGEIKKVGKLVLDFTDKYKITILLKGAVDIIAGNGSWFYSPGGNRGLTKSGTGDILAGIVAALYHRLQDPLIASQIGSYVLKRTAEDLFKDYKDLYNNEDINKNIGLVFETLRSEAVKLV